MLVIGTKGHAKEIIEIIDKEDQKNLVFFDNVTKPIPKLFLERFKVISNLDEVASYFKENTTNFAIAIGGTSHKKIIIDLLESIGGNLVSLIDLNASIGSYDVSIGKGCNIMKQVLISNSVSIGKAVLANFNSSIHHDVIIGDFCEISPRVTILGYCKIGRCVTIGTGAIILPNITIGDYAVIGAGAVVTKNIDPKTTVVGIPANPL